MNEHYLTSFEDQTTALGYTSGDTTLMSPQVSLVGADEVVYSKEIPHESRIKFAKDETTGKLYFFVVEGVLPPNVDAVGPADNEIWYTTNDGQKLVWAAIGTVPATDTQMAMSEEYCVYYTPGDTGYEKIYGYTVISHEYCEDLKCFVIKFDKPLTEVFWLSDHIAFSTGGGRFNITSIQLPKTILRIGDWAFSYQPLSSITIPNSVTSIGIMAFRESDINFIIYEGTKEQWYNALGGYTDLYIYDVEDKDVVIHCTNGDIINKPV